VSFITLDELETREPVAGIRDRFVHSKNVTVASWKIQEGSRAPKHAHPHEQITFHDDMRNVKRSYMLLILKSHRLEK